MATLKAFVGARADEKLYENVPRLGWMVWHEVGDIDQRWAEAKAILKSAGFQEDTLPITTPKGAFLLAMTSVKEGSRSSAVRVLPRPIREDANSVSYQITIEHVKGDELAYESSLKVVFNKIADPNTDRAIAFESVKGAEAARVESEIRTAYARYRDQVYRWTLGKWTTQTLDRLRAVAMRSNGGIWFVPDTETEKVKALESVFEQFGKGSKFLKHPVIDIETWRRDVGEMANRDFLTKIGLLRADLENEIASRKSGKGEIKESSILVKMKNFKEVMDWVETYESQLNYRATEVRDAIDELQVLAKKVLLGEAGLKVKTDGDGDAEQPEPKPKKGGNGKAKKGGAPPTAAKAAKNDKADHKAKPVKPVKIVKEREKVPF